MIVPNPPKQGPTSDTKDKWYLSYFEYLRGYPYDRYMSNDGWKRTATYFNTPEEALAAFERNGQTPLPVSNAEVSDRLRMEQMMKRDQRAHYWD